MTPGRGRLAPASAVPASGAALASFVLLCLVLPLSSCASAAESRRLALAYLEIGSSYAELGKWDKAGAAYEKALAYDASLVEASYNMTRALAERGKYAEALASADGFLATQPDNTLILALKAYALYKSGDAGGALAIYGRIAELDPEDDRSRYNRAILLEASGRTEESRALYAELLARKPGDDATRYRLASILMDMNETAAAVPLLEAYVERKAGDREAARLLASAYERLKLYSKALARYGELASGGKDPAASFSSARIKMLKAEDFESGLEDLEAAILAGWKDAEAAKLLVEDPALADPGLNARVRAVLEKAGIKTGSPKP